MPGREPAPRIPAPPATTHGYRPRRPGRPRGLRFWPILPVLAAVATNGCTPASAPLRSQSAFSVATPTGQLRPIASAHPAPTAARQDRTLKLAFGGDVHFEQQLASAATNPRALARLRGTLGAADASMVNLESAITTRGQQEAKAYQFRAPATALRTLAGAGVDVVTLANNHAVDYGAPGLADTLAARAKSPIPVVGVGRNERDALRPALLQVRGVKVAFFGVDQVLDHTTQRWSAGANSPGVADVFHSTAGITQAVRQATGQAAVVVVYAHWGIEPGACPDGASMSPARQLREAGADVIVGSHTHRLNGAGWLGGSYVAYGLSNFVFYRDDEPSSRTGVLTLTLQVPPRRRASGATARPLVRKAAWQPMLIGPDGIPRIPNQSNQARLAKLFDQARSCTNLAPGPR